MKHKKVIIFVLFLFNMMGLSAQFSVSPNAGVSISKFSNVNNDQMNSLIGFNFGVDVHYAFTERFGVQSGLSLIRKGADDVQGRLNISEPYDVDLISMDMRMDYLELPLIFSFTQRIKEEMRVRLNLGPYFSYGVSGKGSIGRIDQTYTAGMDPFDAIAIETKTHGKQVFPAFNRWDIGCRFNAEVIMYSLKVGLSYDLGFSDISDNFPVRYDNPLRNRTFNLYLGYILPFVH